MPLPKLVENRGRLVASPPTESDIDEAVHILTMLVPLGRVVSYSAIAKVLGLHPRRVALALSRNTKPIVVPCHRVVMKNGSLGGYTPRGTQFKAALLKIEGVEVIRGRIPKTFFADRILEHLLGHDDSGV